MKQDIKNIGEIVSYLFSPEDSRDSMCHSVPDVKLERLPRYAAPLKTALWVCMAFGLAIILSRLQ
jgi:hypothetical protein